MLIGLRIWMGRKRGGFPRDFPPVSVSLCNQRTNTGLFTFASFVCIFHHLEEIQYIN